MTAHFSSGKIAAAFTIAVAADFIQLPLNALTLTGVLAVPSEAVDIVVDMGAFGLTAGLLGFHWALLPTAFLEAVPFVDAFPTWIACVAFVVYQRKQEFARHAQATSAVDMGRARSPSPLVLGDHEQRPVRQVTAVAIQSSKEG